MKPVYTNMQAPVQDSMNTELQVLGSWKEQLILPVTPQSPFLLL